MAQKAQKVQKRMTREQRRIRTNQIIFAALGLLVIAAMVLALVAK